MGLETFASRTGAARLLQRHPQVSPAFPCFHCTPCQDIPIHLTHLHGLDSISSGNIPFPVDTSPIGRPVTSSKLALQICIMSLSTRLGKRGFMSPWRAYLLMCRIMPDGQVPHWTSTHGEMISSDLHGAEKPTRWMLRP